MDCDQPWRRARRHLSATQHKRLNHDCLTVATNLLYSGTHGVGLLEIISIHVYVERVCNEPEALTVFDIFTEERRNINLFSTTVGFYRGSQKKLHIAERIICLKLYKI